MMSTQVRILLVDDEPSITEDVARFVERSGFVVSTASNGEEAIAKSRLLIRLIKSLQRSLRKCK